jgi:DnaJ homolog subfamily B member 11
VIFKLKQVPHPVFRREGNDLHMTMHITLREALLGFSKSFRHLDNREVCRPFFTAVVLHAITMGQSVVSALVMGQVWVESEGITRPFEVRKLVDEGMPVHNVPSDRGTLHIKFEVDFPSSLTAEQKELVKKLFAA